MADTFFRGMESGRQNFLISGKLPTNIFSVIFDQIRLQFKLNLGLSQRPKFFSWLELINKLSFRLSLN